MSKSTKIIAALGVVAGLGVAAMPLSSYAAQKDVQQNLSMEIKEVLTIENVTVSGATDKDNITLSEITDNTTNGATSTGKGAIKVVTNSQAGFKIGITGVGATDRKYNGVTDWETSLVNQFGDKIASKAGTLNRAASGWGFRVDDVSGTHKVGTADAAGTYRAVTTSNVDFATETHATDNNGMTYTLEYGVSAQSDQPAGIYKGAVKYTATTTPGVEKTLGA